MNVAERDTVPTSHVQPTGPAESVAAALRYGRVHDGLGHQIHTILACLYLMLLPLTTAPKDFAFGLLLIWFLIRIPHIWRSFRGMHRHAMVVGLLAWAGWIALSMTWSPDAKQGFDELGAFRVLITPLLLWPILDRLPWLIAAALAGVFAHNAIQSLQILHVLPVEPGEEDRIRGLIHPGKGGAWFVAAMLWHLFAMVNSRNWVRWVSCLLLLVAGAGLIASGSRGAWVSVAVAFPAAMVFTLLRRPFARPMIGLLLVVAALVGIGVWTMARTGIQQRVGDAAAEVRQAREHGVYWTSSGLRIALWSWAWEVFQKHPVIGAGAGGFAAVYPTLDSFKQTCENTHRITLQELAGEKPEGPTRTDQTRADKLSERRIGYLQRDHAHSLYMHTLAQQGAVGMILLIGALMTILIRCLSDQSDHLYSGAAVFIMISWMIGTQFDCYELNGNQLGLLALVVATVMPNRATVRLRWKTADPGEVIE